MEIEWEDPMVWITTFGVWLVVALMIWKLMLFQAKSANILPYKIAFTVIMFPIIFFFVNKKRSED
jgi:predicted histidine transporter YuiF (NhaC family)